MARKIILILLIAGTAFFCGLAVYQYIISGYEFNSVELRAVIAFFAGIAAIARLLYADRRTGLSKGALMDAYGEIIGNAFSDNKRNLDLLLKALSLFNMDKTSQAISLLKKLLDRCVSNRESAVVYHFLAMCYEDSEQPASAIEAYKMAVQKHPALDASQNNLGLLHQHNGDVDEAIQCYERALNANRKNVQAYNNLAIVYLDSLLPDKAIEYALEALKLKPNMYQPMETLALVYALKKEKGLADEYYQRSLVNGCPNPENLRQMMDKYFAG